MTWVKLDDDFPEHPKVDRLSDAAFRLHVAAMCHCSRLLTDGYVGQERVSRLVPRFRPAQVVELTDAGLWEPADCGWQIHDYLLYQPTAEKVKAERAAAAERMRRHRSPERSGEQPANVREKFADPVPVPQEIVNKSSSSLMVVGEAREEEWLLIEAAALHASWRYAEQVGKGKAPHTPDAWKRAAREGWLRENRLECLRILAERPDLDAEGLLRKIDHKGLPGYALGPPVEFPPEEAIEEGRQGAKSVIDDLRERIPTARKKEAS